jgi:hypothetical protein
MVKICRSKWFLPLFFLALGLVMLTAQSAGGHATWGLGSLAIMAGFGALVLLGGRSETIRGLRGDGRDERFRQLDIRATALSGNAAIVAILIGWVVSVSRGDSGMPYTWLGAVAGLAYLTAIVVLRLRG